MNEAADRAITERQRLDHGFGGSLALSVLAHLGFAAVAVALPLLGPREAVLKVDRNFLIALPPAGGGVRAAEPAPAPPPPQPAVEPPEPKPEPPPKVLKPPKEEPRKGLPLPDAHPVKRTPAPAAPPASGRGTAASAQMPGLEIGPPGPGAPGGTDPRGDWYLAGVQRKIWMLWTQQIKAGFTQPVTVRFTITADGQLDPDVRIVESSGVALLDLGAKRAIYSAAPFGPLPRDYGTNRYTIQAVFKPTP
ncbi:MAG TPA: TonB family protein [Vicinamibacteria bacterium]